MREILLDARGVPHEERHRFPIGYFGKRPNGFDFAVLGSSLDLHVHSVGSLYDTPEVQVMRSDTHRLSRGTVAEMLSQVCQVWMCEEMPHLFGHGTNLEATQRVCKVIASLLDESCLAIYDYARSKLIEVTPETAVALRSNDFVHAIENGIQLRERDQMGE